MVHISVLLMVKNEGKHIRKTLDSIATVAYSLIVYDTGSIDDTVSIIENFSQETGIPLHLKRGVFVDFSTSRNILLSYADEFLDTDYYLLMDSNDELKGAELLQLFCSRELHSKHCGWYIHQEWIVNNIVNNYYNIRLIRPRHYWIYKGVVHEYLMNLKNEKLGYECPRLPKEVLLFQDRKVDSQKSMQRYPRDCELLLAECIKNPEDARSHFYLAQTYSSLGKFKDAYEYYRKRTTLKGFVDEVFHCWLRMGILALDLMKQKEASYTWELALGHFMKALECSMRVEPLLYIAEYYMERKKWELAYHFAKIACGLDYPTTSLFVDRYMYHYTRFHLLGIIAYYCGKYKEGLIACKIAIERENREVDRKNLAYYEKKL